MTDRKNKADRSNPDGWVEEHNGTMIFGRESSPEVNKRIQAMNKKIEELKEGKQMGKVVLKDDELLGYINQKKTAQQIIDESGVTLLTLQKRVGKLQQSHKKFYDVPGLFEEEGETIKFGKAGLRIAKAKLENLGYKEEDKFKLEHDDKKKQIILTQVKVAEPKKKK